MQPNEQTQHPIDYLDSISTVPKKTGRQPSNLLFFGALAGGLVVALAVGLFAFLSTKSSSGEDLTTLSIRLGNIQTVVDDSKKNIISSKLRATNTNLALALANANRDLPQFLPEGEVDPAVIARETTEELNKRLEDARLNAVFDRTYAREMSYQLDTTLILLEQLESKTRSESQKKFLTNTHENLQPLQEQFSSFTNSAN